MRKTDDDQDQEAIKHVQKRQNQSLGGVIIAAGGMILAIVNPDLAIYGIGAALIGAGLVDFNTILKAFTK